MEGHHGAGSGARPRVGGAVQTCSGMAFLWSRARLKRNSDHQEDSQSMPPAEPLNPTAISLFAGAGGCSLGFQRAGYSVLFATDKDADAVSTYAVNFPSTPVKRDDIREVDLTSVLHRIGIAPGELDILIGGPPCQGFSTAGARFWHDPRNALLASYVKALEQIRPKWFLMENVEGLLTAKGGVYIYESCKAFIELGYSVAVEKVYTQDYAVPQRRKRVIVVGNRLGIDFSFPQAKTNSTGHIYRETGYTLRRAISGLPKASTSTEPLVYESIPEEQFEVRLRDGSESVHDHYFTPPTGIALERIQSLMPGQTMQHLPEHLQHDSFRKRANRRVRDGTPTEKRGGAPSGLKRLVFDEPCLTITSASTREFVHPIENRPLTIRECARIQTFPDTFIFTGNDTERIRQIGNAIPPDLAEMLARHIATAYGFSLSGTNEAAYLTHLRLTKANAMSPALEKTKALLESLGRQRQLTLF